MDTMTPDPTPADPAADMPARQLTELRTGAPMNAQYVLRSLRPQVGPICATHYKERHGALPCPPTISRGLFRGQAQKICQWSSCCTALPLPALGDGALAVIRTLPSELIHRPLHCQSSISMTAPTALLMEQRLTFLDYSSA
jgi:hypothetical protein